jgi:quinol-cytochrome oxidoreductase complex cytochrome b subunit
LKETITDRDIHVTFSRFFILHVAILPGILIGLICIHLIAFRHFGVFGPWDEKKGPALRPLDTLPNKVGKQGTIY